MSERGACTLHTHLILAYSTSAPGRRAKFCYSSSNPIYLLQLHILLSLSCRLVQTSTLDNIEHVGCRSLLEVARYDFQLTGYLTVMHVASFLHWLV